ncbi:MAG: flavodoxin family protein [bacterium]|jgi:flavodoxin
MRILIAYYSRTGKTKTVAENLAATIEADVEEIRTPDRRQGLLGFLRCGFEACRGKEVRIIPINKEPSSYDLVIVGTPIWAGRMSSPVRSFLSQYGHSIKNVAYIITRADPKNQYLGVCAEMDKISGKHHIAALSLWDRDKAAGEAVTAFAARFKQV